MSYDLEETEDVRKIDRAFEILLLMISIIAAAFSAYASHLASIDVLTLSQVTIHFRRAFLPVLIVCLLWLLSRVLTVNQSFKMWFRILIWTCGIYALRSYFFDLIVFTFFPLGSPPQGISFEILSYSMTILALALSIVIIRKYMKAMNHVVFFNTKLWAVQVALASSIGTLIHAFLMPVYFLGLTQFPMSTFLFWTSGVVLFPFFITFACVRGMQVSMGDQLKGKKPKKNEKKKTEKGNNKISMSKYERTVVIVSVISLLLTFCNIYLISETTRIRRESLEFQNMMYDFQGMMYNFTPVIVARPDLAILGEPVAYLYDDNVTVQTIHRGYLDTELQVVTPHYGNVSIKCKHFNVGESPHLDQGKKNQTTVSFTSESDKYEHLAVPGLNQLNDHIDLEARIFFNPDSFAPDTSWVEFPLGRLFLEAELFDIQTNSTLTKEFSAVVRVTYIPPS